MLQKNAVPPATLELLNQICTLKEVESFGLRGGTSLALRLGHRISIDLDFFTNADFNTGSIFQIITKRFPAAELLFERNRTMMFSINEIKVDFVLYPFEWSYPFEIIENVRLINIEDIIPMKLQAVSNRNAKKDYWDIAALLKTYSLSGMVQIFTKKFPQVDIDFIIHSLTDFEQADTEPNPDISQQQPTWSEIKFQLTEAVKSYTNSLI